jgi:hypothetical protein
MKTCEINHEEDIFEGMRDELRHLFDVAVGDADWLDMKLEERAAWLREAIESVFGGQDARIPA